VYTHICTGKLGLIRNLTSEEIIVQLFLATRVADEEGLPGISNVVFMGVYVCVCVCMCVCVSVCERERERERERKGEREREREKERERQRERDRERERHAHDPTSLLCHQRRQQRGFPMHLKIGLHMVWVCGCGFVCVRERERERDHSATLVCGRCRQRRGTPKHLKCSLHGSVCVCKCVCGFVCV